MAKARGTRKGEGDGEQRPDGGRVAAGVEHEGQRAGELAGVAADGDALAVDPVGERAGDEHEHGRRQELGETEETEVDGAPGDVEHLLAEHRGLEQLRHRGGERHGQQRGDVAVGDDLADAAVGGRLDDVAHGWTTLSGTCLARLGSLGLAPLGTTGCHRCPPPHGRRDLEACSTCNDAAMTDQVVARAAPARCPAWRPTPAGSMPSGRPSSSRRRGDAGRARSRPRSNASKRSTRRSTPWCIRWFDQARATPPADPAPTARSAACRSSSRTCGRDYAGQPLPTATGR